MTHLNQNPLKSGFPKSTPIDSNFRHTQPTNHIIRSEPELTVGPRSQACNGDVQMRLTTQYRTSGQTATGWAPHLPSTAILDSRCTAAPTPATRRLPVSLPPHHPCPQGSGGTSNDTDGSSFGPTSGSGNDSTMLGTNPWRKMNKLYIR